MNNALYKEFHDAIARISVGAAKMCKYSISKDEAIQVGWVAFLEAAQRWDRVTGNLIGFASMRIHGAVIDEVRKRHCKRKYIDGTKKFISNGQCSLNAMEEEVADALMSYEDNHTAMDIDNILQQVENSRHNLALTMYFKHDMSQEEIGVMLGVSGSRVSQMMTTTMKKIKRMGRDKIESILEAA